jgi:hypothetical protein
MVAAHGGAGTTGAGSSIHGSSAGGIEVHSHVYLDGRQVYRGMPKQAVTTQRRTGRNGLSKRSR